MMEDLNFAGFDLELWLSTIIVLMAFFMIKKIKPRERATDEDDDIHWL